MNRCLFGNYEYIFENEKNLKKAITNAVNRIDSKDTPVRVVFFGRPGDNKEYSDGLKQIKSAITARWGDKSPVVTYVAQPPLGGESLAVEVHTVSVAGNDKIEYKNYERTPYIVISGDWGRKIVTGGIQGDDLDSNMRIQSDEVFEIIRGIIKEEGLRPENIIRQWNYLERITDYDGDIQRYQAFNDSRSVFYAEGNWDGGYPAATGIGAQWGGVVVELDAMKLANGIGIKGIDNALQIAAHDYSKKVLLGEGQRSTPKFERAKALWDNSEGLVYVSGTAAIRGEKSLTDSGIEEQTATTLENIDFLTSALNLKSYGVELDGVRRYKYFRVYLKDPKFLEAARGVIESSHADVPTVYLWSDVCRCELLVEIEGISTINY